MRRKPGELDDPGKMVKGWAGQWTWWPGRGAWWWRWSIRRAKGAPKILKKCTLPLTGVKVVDTIVTEMAYIRVTERGLVLEEVAPGLTAEDVQRATEARLIVSEKFEGDGELKAYRNSLKRLPGQPFFAAERRIRDSDSGTRRMLETY
jgi:hypothetical protein